MQPLLGMLNGMGLGTFGLPDAGGIEQPDVKNNSLLGGYGEVTPFKSAEQMKAELYSGMPNLPSSADTVSPAVTASPASAL